MDEKTEQEKALEAKNEEVKAENAKRTGKGTRLRVGQTRGRNPQVITFEAFDESLPDTLPATLSEFMTLAKTDDEKLITSYLIDGYNAASYTLASDPIAEFVDAAWSEDLQKGFRTSVRAYSVNAGVSIEDAVALIKPGIAAAHAKAKTAAVQPTA
jgi:hypothetical protein